MEMTSFAPEESFFRGVGGGIVVPRYVQEKSISLHNPIRTAFCRTQLKEWIKKLIIDFDGSILKSYDECRSVTCWYSRH